MMSWVGEGDGSRGGVTWALKTTHLCQRRPGPRASKAAETHQKGEPPTCPCRPV